VEITQPQPFLPARAHRPSLRLRTRLDTRLWRNVSETAIQFALTLCAAATVLTTIGIVVALFGEAIGFFAHPEVTIWGYLTGATWKPLAEPVVPQNFGVLPLVGGTFLIAGLAALIALPLGLGAAIYLSEYAPTRVRSTLKPMLEVLAGIPSVVYGYFAITLITPLLRSAAESLNTAAGTELLRVDFFNAASASVVLGVMIVPLVASISEDAMRAVPGSLREGAYGLGATRFEVSTKVVVPAALSGILAGFILAVSRAIGETMIVAIAAGSTPRLTLNPFQSVQTMTGFIVQVAFGDNPVGSLGSQTIFAVGATLFLMTFVMNVASNLIMRRFREEYQ
jgi:phosphate transport system permease protein